MENCPICNTKVKNGIFSSNYWIENFKLDIINEYSNIKYVSICYNCSTSLYPKSIEKIQHELSDLKNKIKEYQNRVRIYTTESIESLEYEYIDYVSTSLTIGTSLLSEVTSALSDVVGNESIKYKNIIDKSENVCLSRLKKIATEKNGNTIFGFKFNITEVGGSKGMLLLSMYGTLVNIKNNNANNFNELDNLNNRYTYLKKLKDNIKPI